MPYCTSTLVRICLLSESLSFSLVTLLCTRQPSRDTQILWHCCWSTGPSPTRQRQWARTYIMSSSKWSIKVVFRNLMELLLCVWQNGTSALAIAKRLGYISVIDVLKLVTEETVSMVRSSEMLLSPQDTMLALCGHDNHMETLSQLKHSVLSVIGSLTCFCRL